MFVSRLVGFFSFSTLFKQAEVSVRWALWTKKKVIPTLSRVLKSIVQGGNVSLRTEI